MISYIEYFLFFAAVLFLIVRLVINTSRLQKQRRINEILAGIYSSGKIIHGDTVYTVKGIYEDTGPAARKGHPKYLVVSRPGNEKVFKLPIEAVSPYNEDYQDKALLYK